MNFKFIWLSGVVDFIFNGFSIITGNLIRIPINCVGVFLMYFVLDLLLFFSIKTCDK